MGTFNGPLAAVGVLLFVTGLVVVVVGPANLVPTSATSGSGGTPADAGDQGTVAERATPGATDTATSADTDREGAGAEVSGADEGADESDEADGKDEEDEDEEEDEDDEDDDHDDHDEGKGDEKGKKKGDEEGKG